MLRGVSGGITIDGKPAFVRDPSEARLPAFGMALIPEDRKTEGLMLPMSIADNLCFAALDRISSRGIIDRKTADAKIKEMIDLLQIKVASADLPVSSLSGGNQQKVVIAKWLMNSPRIVLLNDPTRGIDVGTKQEIYVLLRKLAQSGVAILFYSTDYDELIGCCDRVLVMYGGAIVRELEGDAITEHATCFERPEHRRGATPMNEWRYWFAENKNTLMAVALFVFMFAIYAVQPPGRLHAECGADSRKQGNAAGLCRHGAIACHHHGRHRSFRWNDPDAGQLPCLVDRGRHRAGNYASAS